MEKCREVTQGYTTSQECDKWPQQVCSLSKQTVKKYSPETEVRGFFWRLWWFSCRSTTVQVSLCARVSVRKGPIRSLWSRSLPNHLREAVSQWAKDRCPRTTRGNLLSQIPAILSIQNQTGPIVSQMSSKIVGAIWNFECVNQVGRKVVNCYGGKIGKKYLWFDLERQNVRNFPYPVRIRWIKLSNLATFI